MFIGRKIQNRTYISNYLPLYTSQI